MSQLFGGIRQVGYVVRDIEAAMQQWIAMGVGPWSYRAECPVAEFRYHGQASALPRMAIALANSGDLQIELIQPLDDAPSLYRDFLDAGAHGVQHIAYWTEHEFDAWCQALVSRGFREGHAGRIGAQGRFAYFVHPDQAGTVIEISETSGGKRQRFEDIRAAALNWDGSDPVRRMAPAGVAP